VSGGSDFCEVFLNDVRIPDSQRLGRVGDGWSVCLTTLMNERFNAGDAYRPDASELLALAKRLKIGGKPAIENAAVRERIAEWHIQSAGAKFTKFRTLTALSRGQTPGAEASILKLVNASKLQDIGAYGMDQLGMAGILADAEEDDEQFLLAYLAAPGARIAGGTDEILRNIIAERVLSLPGDIRVDKELPFNKLAGSAK
jgi:alkylation response protein AidB-like acyl-CoA dehydrogenase